MTEEQLIRALREYEFQKTLSHAQEVQKAYGQLAWLIGISVVLFVLLKLIRVM